MEIAANQQVLIELGATCIVAARLDLLLTCSVCGLFTQPLGRVRKLLALSSSCGCGGGGGGGGCAVGWCRDGCLSLRAEITGQGLGSRAPAGCHKVREQQAKAQSDGCWALD